MQVLAEEVAPEGNGHGFGRGTVLAADMLSALPTEAGRAERCSNDQVGSTADRADIGARVSGGVLPQDAAPGQLSVLGVVSSGTVSTIDFVLNSSPSL